jgi:signal transduction histidine kinase
MESKKSLWALVLRVGLMVGATAAVGLAFWNPLSSEARSHASRITKAFARSLETDILDEVRHQVLAQVRLASLRVESKLPRRIWESQATLFMTHHPGYLAIQWLDATYHSRSMIPNETEANPGVLVTDDASLRRVLEEEVNHCQEEALFTPVFRLLNGDAGRRIVVPICRKQDLLGFLIAVVDEPKVLAQILEDDTGLGYGIAIFDGDQKIFGTSGTGSGNDKKWLEDAEVPLRGATWHVQVWPESVLLHKIESRLPEEALLMGSLIGLLLFTTLDFARTSYFRAQELRRAHYELESRVEQRTTELKQANKKLEAQIHERKRAEESLQELSGRLLQLRDEEQRRIARELHDSTVQIMGALAVDLERVQQSIPKGDLLKAQRLLADSRELVKQATTELRTMSYLLHPPILDDLGLEGVLPWYAAGFSGRSGIQVNVRLQSNLGRFPHELELTLFRIVQEGLTNIHHHSGSPTADIIVTRDSDRVTLQIVDYGRGIPRGTIQPGGNMNVGFGVGIAGMRERVRQLAGELQIESGDNGTTITAVLPTANATPVAAQTSDNHEGQDTPQTS